MKNMISGTSFGKATFKITRNGKEVKPSIWLRVKRVFLELKYNLHRYWVVSSL